MQVKIIEQDWKKCEDLCDQLPKATIICGNAADHDLLIEEGIEQADALVSLTGMDEENIILALLQRQKVWTRSWQRSTKTDVPSLSRNLGSI